MSEGTDGPVVGVLSSSDSDVSAAVASGGARVRAQTDTAFDDSGLDALVAVGERAMLDLVRGDSLPSVPVLPVDAGAGVRSVPRAALASAVEHLATGEFGTQELPVLAVTVDGEQRTRALFDATLVTAEPARISEYRLASGGRTVAQFRADGVVVATPAGSHGYARRVDGPVVAPDTDVLAAAPIAPFATDADHWVLPEGAVGLSVERDEAPVELLADDRRVCTVTPADEVGLSRTDSLSVATVPEGRGAFGRP